jgi:hypothetical protein
MADVFLRERYEKAIELRRQGLGFRRIAKEVGVSEGTVSGWLYYGKKPRDVIGSPHQLTDYERGFLEGLIDGEGYFILSLKNRGVTALVGISNTCLPFLEKAKSILGGGRIDQSKKGKPNSRPVYHLIISSNILRWLLPQLRLVVKESQRLVMLQALDVLASRRGGKARWHGKETWKEIEQLVLRMKELNRKGKNGR